MKIKITLAALTLASLSEFLLAYPIQATIQPSEKQIEVFNGDETVNLPFAALNETNGEAALQFLFEFIAPGDESVIADWNLHVDREEYTNQAPQWIKPLADDEQEFEFGAKEKFILEINEERPERMEA